MHNPVALHPLVGDAMRHGWGMTGLNYAFAHVGVPMHMHVRVLNGFVYGAARIDAPESERPRVQGMWKEALQARSRVNHQYWTNEVLPTLLETYRWVQAVPVETAPIREIAHAWDEFWVRIAHIWGLHFIVGPAAYRALEDLADLYEAFTENAHPGEALMMVAGWSTDLQRVQQDLYLLAEQARSSPAVSELILGDHQPALATLPQVSGGEEFLRALRGFLDSHGHLGGNLVLPSWEDDPTLVLIEVRKRLQHPQEDPGKRRQHLRANADTLADRVRAKLRDRPADLDRFEAALTLAREVGPLTETHNYWLDRMLTAQVHRFLVRIGKRLVAATMLDDPPDVFYLHVDEIKAALEEPSNLRSLVADRKIQHARWTTLTPPQYLGAPPPPAPPGRFNPNPAQQTDGPVLRGIGASAGISRGPVRVVLTPEGFGRVQPGDVLVCPASEPSWVPLFGIIAALITNTGGVTSHAAVVAREFGVPAVVGVRDATQRLRDGQHVEVDGTAGVVRLA